MGMLQVGCASLVRYAAAHERSRRRRTRRAGESPEQRLKWLDTARLGCLRAFELVQQLSQLADGQELDREPIDPGDMFGDVVSLVRDVSSTDISFSFQQQDTRPILANRGQLGQVVLNLLFNARDAVVERAASEPN